MSKYEDAIERMIEGIHTDYLSWNQQSQYALDNPQKISIIEGRKFDKLIAGSSVWGFIAKADGTHKGVPYAEGDVFKPASWASPAKFQRGSIYSENQGWFAWTGPRYL